MAKIVPLTIIAGFLGSGKTSLLNHLLSQSGDEQQGRKITALVNDFGALNIDAELIARQNGSQVELANGCVCCSIGDDLMQTLAGIMRAPERPDHIIIEASGVADPARIAAYASVDPELRLDGIATLVDASAHYLHADDPHLADNYARQIDGAHILLISKTDLVEADFAQALQDDLSQARPGVPVLHTAHGRLPIDLLLGLNGDMPVARSLDTHGLESRALHMHGRVDREGLAERLLALRPHVLRAKGILTDNQGPYVIHFAGGRVSHEAFDGEPSGHMVLIGKPGLPLQETLSAHLHH
jgi:G3E family GTPase